MERALQGPACRSDASVLVRVGVADHHHLATLASAEVGAQHGICEHPVQHGFGSFEVGHGLEERVHVERYSFGVTEAPEPRQP